MPRYQSGRLVRGGTGSRSGARRNGERSPQHGGRTVRAGRPLAARTPSRRSARTRRGGASSRRPPTRWLRTVLILLAVAAILGLGGYSTVRATLLSRFVGIVVVRDGKIEDVISAQGFVIRDETVLRSPVTGTLSLSLKEGDRARTGAEVVSLSDTEERRQANVRVGQLEADLQAFNANYAEEEQSLGEELTGVRAEAEAKAEELRAACAAGDGEAIARLAKELGALVSRQKEAATRLDAIRSDRAAIEQALATAKEALAKVIFPVLAPQAGFVSYRLDGLEEILTPDSIGQYGTKQVLTLVRRDLTVVDQARAQAGNPVARVVADTEAYLSVIVTNSQADRLVEARKVTLRFPGFEGRRETEASLFHVGDREKNGYCLVTYRTEELLAGMVSAREVEASIVVHTYTGTVVPRKAVVRRGGEDGVFVLEATVCRFRPVIVLGSGGEETVVTGLKAGTPVISTPWLVKEGLRIG